MPLTNPNRENKRAKVVVFQPRKSWTHDFCLLSENSRSVTPSVRQLSKLKDAGLGRKRIVFPDKKASFVKVKSILELEYPKLKSQDGAFEFMRAEGGGNSRPLCLIPMPAAGHNIPYLKEIVGSSTLIYIRPMKSVISMEKSYDISTMSASPTTECAGCKERVPISILRQHNLECQPINADSGESDEEDNLCQHNVECKPVTIDTGKSEWEQELLTKDVVSVIDEGEGPSKITWSTQLKELFPNSKIEELEEVALQSTSMDEAAEFMLDKHGTDQDERASLEDLIQLFVKKKLVRTV